MKLSLLFLMTLTFSIQAKTSYGQKAKISLDMHLVRVEQVMDEIEATTEFKFFFKTKTVDLNRKVSIKVKNENIEKVLKILFDEKDISYDIQERIILLKKNFLKNDIIKESFKSSSIKLQNEVNGSVVDGNGMPLPGANIIEKGTRNGVTADIDGNFTISLTSQNPVLVISYIGFLTKEILVGGENNLKIVLVENAAGLDEVVVVGYGTQRKSDLTGSIASISSKDYEKQPITQVETVLQGRAAGVQVVQTNGGVPNGFKIRIRGANSIDGNNRPLYVVDGFVAESLSSINPNDIASMEILKDASATAIYGSRGANGVVLITTKKGERGESSISVDVFTSAASVYKKLDVMSPADFARGVNFAEDQERFTPEEIVDLENGGGTNWQDLIFKSAFTKNYQISAQGGKENMDYYVSANYYTTEGIIINDSYNRYLLRSKLNFDINDNLRAGFNIVGSMSDSDGFTTNVTSALTYDMTTPPYDEDGNYNIRSIKSDIGNAAFNPLLSPNEIISNSYNRNARGDGYIDYKFGNYFTFNVTGGIDWRNIESNRYTPQLISNLGAATVSSDTYLSYQNTNRLTFLYDKNENHRLQIDAIHEQYKSTFQGLTANAQGFISDNTSYKDLSLGEIQRTSNNYSTSSLQSFLGRMNYSLFNRYLFTGSLRADASSKFRKENRWGYFPSGSFAWKISEENFLKNVESVNNLKLRLSYGVTGSQAVDVFATRARTVTGLNVNYPLTGGSYFTGIAPSGRLANPDLTWEKTQQGNIGVDLGLWGSKVTFSADVYKKHTYDLLLDRILPEFVGPTVKAENVGQVDNTGFEFALGLNTYSSKDFNISTTLTFNRNINEVKSLIDGQEFLEKGNPYDNGVEVNPTRIEVGKPISTFRGYIFDGVYQLGEEDLAAVYGKEPGDAKYRDLNGDDAITTDDITTIGDGNPDFTYGINSTITYKNLDLNLLFIGSKGNDIYNLLKARMLGIGVSAYHASHEEYNDRWTPDNPSNVPATRDGTFMASTQFLEGGSYLALRNLSLGYNLEFKGIDNLRLYATVENAFILTNYTGYDPITTSSGASDVDLGIDYGAYPLSRTFTLGLNVKF